MNYVLSQDKSLFIAPTLAGFEGYTESGIYLQRKDFMLNPSWRNSARVTQIHPTCTAAKVGDFVLYRKHAPLEIGDYFVLFESQILCFLRKADGGVWYT
jgi:hypothetical protein